MNDIIEIKSYGQYKQMLDTELQTSVNSFVKIGYLLKVARDTNVLAESGYQNVADFAKAEYGLTKDIVSRYIAINDRYSQDGYSDRLQDRFEGFGVAKLAEMLTLPDSIIAEIEPTLTRKEIQEIKKEVAEEEAITPLKVLAEAAETKNRIDEDALTITQRIWKAYYHENREQYKKLRNGIEPVTAEGLFDALAPTGMAFLFARVAGVGKFMITIKGKDQPINMTNTRTGEITATTLSEVYEDLKVLFIDFDIMAWELLFNGEEFEPKKAEPAPAPKPEPKHEPKPEPKKQEVAPVQPEKETEKEEEITETADSITDTDDSLLEAPKEAEAAVIGECSDEGTIEAEEEIQIPGQMEIVEVLPSPELIAEIMDERPEHEIVCEAMDTVLKIRRIMSQHVVEDNEPMDDTELDETIEAVGKIDRLLRHIKIRRTEE